jgi:ABC-type bacteriocin/lantibiotic exporter with double-glycine peptidase domain
VAFFRGRTVGALATAVLSVSSARDVLATVGTQTLFLAIVAVANLGLIFSYSVPFGLVAIAVVAFAMLVAAYANIAQVRRQREAFAASQDLNARTFELVMGVAKLRAAAAEDRAFARWAPAFAASRTATFGARVAQNRITVFNAAVALLGTMTLFLFASRVVDIDTAAFLVVFTAFSQLLASAVAVSNTIATVVAVVPYLEGIGTIVKAEQEVSSAKVDPGELAGDVEVSHVTFRYAPELSPALEDVSFHAKPGEFVAIVGPSGCGKSTLLRMLLGFDEPELGAVLYNGSELSGLDAGAVRRQCGVVLQNGQLFAGDLATNIAGSGSFSQDEVLEAARMAGLGDDIAAMPMGLNTMVSESSATISGGQRQRVMIARALIGKPRILFFDEATSALDNATQAVVTESTRLLNATRIVIAHRLSTVIDADRIVVMEAGRVVQTGTYEELSQQDGLFRRLAERQVA